MRRISVLVGLVTTLVLGTAATAFACGSLVAPNGAVQLVRTTTLAAHHDGVEHYVTNFEFASDEPSFGSIIPLPGEPTTVERAGDWTLQRLQREVAPPPTDAFLGRAQAASAEDVDVLQRTQIDALDVTILRGGGAEVADWAAQQGFTLTPDTPEVLDFYSQRSPYFMAAKFDAGRAAADDFQGGDGIPVHLAIPLDHPWVPLRILATGKPADEIVEADVFLLTDDRPELLAGTGLTLVRSEPASRRLLDDLRSDQNSSWVPEKAWFSYLRLEAEVRDLSYDLATSVGGGSPSVVDAGRVDFDRVGELSMLGVNDEPARWPWDATVALSLVAVMAIAMGWLLLRPPRRPATRAPGTPA